jgi:hypothetical protein
METAPILALKEHFAEGEMIRASNEHACIG